MRAIFRNLVIALFGAVLSLGFYGQEAEAVLKGSGAASSVSAAAYPLLAPDGAVGTPSYSFSTSPGTGMWLSANNQLDFSAGSANVARFNSTTLLLGTTSLTWGTSPSANDVFINRVAANTLKFGSSTATTTSRTELNKAVTTISNAVATSVLTITIPNAAHSGTLMVRLTCSLGAGGVIGANEATATNSYMVSITRTAGVNATAAISAAYGAAATAVAGASTVTATAALAAVGGAVGATNTIDVQATVSRSASTSDNHTCLVYGQLMNSNVTGITIS